MLIELAALGGLVGMFVGLLEISHRLEETVPEPLSPEAAVREAMRGPDGSTVRAEFRRSGIVPADRGRGLFGFGV
jgi:hypothetical protein